jgi:S-DNA-T family DNA segregation ATPase FtsK/SpoIIIE
MGRKKKKDKKRDGADGGSFLGLSQETKNSIYGIMMFLMATLATLSFFDLAGIAGEYFNSFAHTLFGWGFFLIPFAFVIMGVAFIKSVSHEIQRSAVWGTLLFVFGFLGIFYILGEGDMAVRIEQGGYLGLILGYPTLRFIGFWASLIVLIFVCFVSLMASLDVAIYELIKRGFVKARDAEEDDDSEEEVVPIPDKPAMEKLVIRTGGAVVGEEARAKKPVVKDEPDFVFKTTKSGKWKLPPSDILSVDSEQPKAGDINSNAAIIKRTLADFNINVEMGEVSVGPTVTQYTFRPAVGVKLSKITTLRSDMALALAAHPIRIEAPIPGKSLVGIEVPNTQKALVGLGDLLGGDDYRGNGSFLPLVVGRDVAGYGVFASLEKMPHLLIAGATGTGKSVCINAIILSMLYRHSPDILKFIFIDPKRVELSIYNGIPHLITPVITEPKKAIAALRWAVNEMERRYETLQASGSRDIFSYNSKKKDNVMPFLVIVIDELADLMAAYGRDIEGAIVRLAQMARAVGIHLIVSTQRPSVEVITGLIKANITTRIAFQVGSQVDSRTILDGAGAEQLLGDGDMLFQQGDASRPRRVQGAFVSEKEAKQVAKFIKDQADEVMEEEGEPEMEIDLESQPSSGGLGNSGDDELYDDAKEVVVLAGKASASLLQRRLRVGYARAARLIDILEDQGIIGPGEGAKPREVYVKANSEPVEKEI